MSKMTITIVAARDELRFTKDMSPEGWKGSTLFPKDKDDHRKTVLVIEYRAEQDGHETIEATIELDQHYAFTNTRGIADAVKKDVSSRRQKAAQSAYVASLAGQKLEVEL